MFEFAELEHRVGKRTYRRDEPKLREALLDAQYDLYQNASFSALVVIAGVDGAGKGGALRRVTGSPSARTSSTGASRSRPRTGATASSGKL